MSSLFIVLFKNADSKENYVVTIVNKLPITKFDILNRSKLIASTIDNNFTLKNLENYYDQALKTLINEKILEACPCQRTFLGVLFKDLGSIFGILSIASGII